MSAQIPKWEDGTRPTIAKQATGWGVGDSPTHDEFNWLNHQTYRNLQSIGYVKNGWRFRNNVTNETPSQANPWNACVYAEAIGLFVAVTSSGANRVMTSPDGETWTNRSASQANSWISLCWSPELNLLVAVSFDGANRVMTSPDGINWTNRNATEANQWLSVCWANSLGLFVAIAADGTNRVMTSPNGITWTARSAAQANDWYMISWSPELALLAAVSLSGTNRVMTSPDGETWTVGTIAANAWNGLCWSSALHLFCAITAAGEVAYSNNGLTWTTASEKLPEAGLSYTNVCALDDWHVIMACSFAGAFSISIDGEYWQSFPCTDINARAIAFSSSLRRAVITGTTAAGVNLIK